MGKQAGLAVGVVLTAALIAVLTASATEASAIPARIVGTWSRHVTNTDWMRAGSFNDGVGVYSIVVTANGALAVYYPSYTQPSLTTRISVLPEGRLTIGSMAFYQRCSGKDLYAWKVVGRLLTVTKLSDAHCPPRVALLVGTWKRK